MNWKGGICIGVNAKKYKREKMAEYLRKRPATYKAIARKAARKFHLKLYGLTSKSYEALIESQKNCCAICGTGFSWTDGHNRKPHIDHDHKTKQVRAILCGRCNIGIAAFLEKPMLLHAASEYLRMWKKEDSV